MITARPIEAIRTSGILPITRGLAHTTLLVSAEVLAAERIAVIEVTLDSPEPHGGIAALRRYFSDRITVGAGTARSAETAARAEDAGAQFSVTPHAESAAIDVGCQRGLAVIAGALTPTEIVQARDRGVDMVKVFPAAPLGPEYIRLILSPLKDIPLVPTGGINAANAGAFIAAGAAAVGVGSSLLGARAADRAWLQGQARALIEAVKGGRDWNA